MVRCSPYMTNPGSIPGTSLTSITTCSPGDPQAEPQAQPWYMGNPSGTAVLDSHMGMSVGGAENWPPEHCMGSGGPLS